MSKEKETPQEAEEPVEDRIDEFAISAFERLGYEGRLPDSIVEVYREFKSHKDRLHPGRLSPEGFAAVVTIAKVFEAPEV